MSASAFVARLFACSGLAAGLLVTGCPTTEDPAQTNTSESTDDDNGETTDDPTDPTSATEPVDPTDPLPTDTDPTNPVETDTSDPTTDTDGVDFIVPPDGGPANECDIWAQDCPAGEKCMPWDNAGGSSWNATRCSPIAPDPGQPGDPCTVEGSGVSGVDDCALSSMCWNVDGKTNEGTCVGFCEGSEMSPVCPDPDEGCSITNEGVLILCLFRCDALLQNCAEGEACYPEPNGFFCSPDASGEMGAYGDPCEYLNVCDVGLYCADAETVPGCAGALGCCSEFCDTEDPMPNCSGTDQECLAWYEEAPPPGYETHGVCALPV